MRSLRFIQSDPTPDGRVTIYAEPKPGHSYSLGLDAALGIKGKDAHAGVLLDDKGEQVATIHGWWETELVDRVLEVADYFGRHQVFVVGEAAKECIPTLRLLYDADCWMYWHRAEEVPQRPIRDKLGHYPVQWDPPVMFLRTRLKQPGRLVVRDAVLHQQLSHFGFRPRSSAMSEQDADRASKLTWGAPPGEHDDLVRACALAVAGLEWLPKYEPPKAKYATNTIGHLIGADKDDEPKKSIWE